MSDAVEDAPDRATIKLATAMRLETEKLGYLDWVAVAKVARALLSAVEGKGRETCDAGASPRPSTTDPVLRQALEKIRRTPSMPFPDPGAHSSRAWGASVHSAWQQIQAIARAALASPSTEGAVILPARPAHDTITLIESALHVGMPAKDILGALYAHLANKQEGHADSSPEPKASTS